jgi:hypothetical protein
VHKYVSTYHINGKTKKYICDFLLKPKYHNTKLPSVIEVKGGNLFSWYRRNSEKLLNYSKFSSVINKGLTILVIDHRLGTNKNHLIKLNNLAELDELFS